MRVRSADEMEIDAALASMLHANATRAPMPDGLFDVPNTWVRRRFRWAAVGRWTAMATSTAVAAGLIVLLLSRLDWPSPAPHGSAPRLSGQTAAVFLGIDQRLTIETEDGVLAIRFAGGQPLLIEVVLVTEQRDRYEVQVLARAEVSRAPVRVPNLQVTTISCRPASRLARPDMVFGYVRLPEGRVPVDVRLTVSDRELRGTTHGGVFLFALPPGYAQPRDRLAVTAFGVLQVPRTEAPGGSLELTFEAESPIAPNTFQHTDACFGEVIGE